MDINHYVAQYGYAALIIGSLAEGETITLLGGVAAHQGVQIGRASCRERV